MIGDRENRWLSCGRLLESLADIGLLKQTIARSNIQTTPNPSAAAAGNLIIVR
jgi:hypothetical protein